MISGWAKRQMGELDAAEKILLEATTLDPKSARSLFELGKVYQAAQKIDKAMTAYHKALSIIFDEKESSANSH
jgi:tetratricopeptide (TPR) repeat protein